MKTIPAAILFSFLLVMICNQSSAQQTNTPVNKQNYSKMKVSKPIIPGTVQAKAGKPIFAAKKVLKDFPTFWDYYKKNVLLDENFLSYDSTGKKISKTVFLTQLKTGKFFPLQVHSAPTALAYQLHNIPAYADSTIANYMRDLGKTHLTYYQMEGKKAPEFSFTDLNGKTYTSENTKGKIVLFKCWFTRCSACVAEMPELNKLVEKYKDRNDILFISLVIDGKKEVQQFLSKTQFDYAAVSGQGPYMEHQLNVAAYPTHFLINKEGNIVYISQYVDRVARHLEKELAL